MTLSHEKLFVQDMHLYGFVLSSSKYGGHREVLLEVMLCTSSSIGVVECDCRCHYFGGE